MRKRSPILRPVVLSIWTCGLLWPGLLPAQVAPPAPAGEAADEPAEEAPRTVTKPPKLVHFVAAIYPTAEESQGVQSSVVLTIAIGADGRVTEVQVATSGGAAFDAAAVVAAREFLFEPAHVDGQPAPVRITYKYDFTIKEQKVKLGPQVNFDGVVLDRYTRKPVVGVQVRIKDLGQQTSTDPLGQFSFVDLPLGTHQIELSGPSLVNLTTEEQLVAGIKKSVRYRVEQRQEGVDEEIVVRAPRIKKESVETSIRSEEARRVPGTQGDTLKVVQNLPGVARSALGSGALVVWGSAPAETRVAVDGVEIPALYHLGGLRSTVNSELVKSIELLPGGYGADYGRGLGGLLRVQTRPLPEKGIHGYVSADLLDASAMLSAALGKRLRIAVAGRFSYLDKLLPLFTKQDFGDFVPIPRYDDYQVQASLRLRKDEELQALFLASDDHLERSIAALDPAQRRTQNTDTSYYRLLLRYTRLLPDGASLHVTPSIGLDTQRATTAFGAVPTSLQTAALRLGLRAGYRRKLAKPLVLSLGVDLLGTRAEVSRAGSVNLPAREGDVTVFGQPPGDDVNADRWRAGILNTAPYAFAELTAGPITITPGLRLDVYAIDGDHLKPQLGLAPVVGYSRLLWALDPRLSLTYRAHRRVSLTASGGIYHQAPEPEELSAVFGNPQLELSRAIHASLALQLKLTGTLQLEAVGYFKYLDSLVMRNALPSPALAQALVQDGVGRSYGGQVLLRQELWKGFFGWVTYALSRSERRNHPDLPWRLFDYDQTHSLTILASYEWRGFAFGVRFRYGTSAPRTPVVGAFYDARGDQYQPRFGAQNSIRIPDFAQLDLRVEKTFTRARWKLNIFADLQNVTNRMNPEEITYTYDFSSKAYITGLPILAVIGAKVQF